MMKPKPPEGRIINEGAGNGVVCVFISLMMLAIVALFAKIVTITPDPYKGKMACIFAFAIVFSFFWSKYVEPKDSTGPK